VASAQDWNDPIDSERKNRLNLANRITLTRIILVPIFITLLLYHSPERAYLHTLSIFIFLAACFSDALDGYLARQRGETTELGSYIDPIADKLLLLSGFLCLSLINHLPSEMHIPAWVTIPIISRDVIIVIGSVIVFFTSGKLQPKPIFIGKITTVVQMITLFSSLIMAPQEVRLGLQAAAVLFTVWSGILYVQMGGKILQES
jgi:cardiolipin synthase